MFNQREWIFLVSLIVLASCSFHSPPPEVDKQPSIEPPKEKEVLTEEIPKIEEPQNLDLDFQKSLNQIWSNYYADSFNETKTINVYIATNRKLEGTNFGCSNLTFGVDREERLKDSQYRIGVCRVNVPKNHTTGEVKFENDPRSDSHQFYKMVGVKGILEDQFLTHLKQSKRIPLIFVHGFNVRYQDAILRVAQIAYDLKYQGPVLLFSWPAGARDGFLDETLINKTYQANKENAQLSVKAFKNYLQKFFVNKIPVNIVVHSMGHQVALPALKELSIKNSGSDFLVNELILNAPDYEVYNFQETASLVKKITKRITLYCSYNDKAMVASSSYNKNVRLGACANIDDVDTINVGQIDDKTFGLGHSYYSSRAVLTDVFQVLIGIDADKRLFIKKSEPNTTEKFYLRN